MSESTYRVNASVPAASNSSAWSVLLSAGDTVQAASLREGQSLVIGRSPPAQLVMNDLSLSRLHARLSVRNGKVQLEDLGSTNGCHLNGVQVRQAGLSTGDLVSLGSVELFLCRRSMPAPPRSLDPIDVTSKRVAEPCARTNQVASTDRLHGLVGTQLSPPHLVVRSPAMERLYQLVTRAARATLPVLIQGETGSGKELVARALHEFGPRKDFPFRALNCGAIPANLVEGVLFGHERGAFSGAERQSRGVFEQAHGGTVFLDEVAELPPAAQTALLRVLEQRKVMRIGGSREIDLDVRIVAATHRCLDALVADQCFREDLQYRLDALTLQVPPLRERREEILPLARLFLERARAEWDGIARELSGQAEAALVAYDWPGNVRELKNVIDRAMVVCESSSIARADLPAHVVSGRSSDEASAEGLFSIAAPQALPVKVRAFEVACIRRTLEESGGNLTQAARLLGLPRKTLTTKMQTYGLARPG